MVHVETDRLNIHVASQDEMQELIEQQSDDVLRTAYQEMLQGCLDRPQCWEWHAIWMIELKEGAHVGELCFRGINVDGSVEIGYGITQEHQGCGYATEAVDAVTRWALEQDRVICVEAETEPDNKASIRVLEKCGFNPTGIIGEEGPRYTRKR